MTDSVAGWLAMKYGIPAGVAEAHAGELVALLGLRREWGVKEVSEPEPGWLSEAPDLPVREGELLMVRWLTEWKADDE